MLPRLGRITLAFPVAIVVVVALAIGGVLVALSPWEEGEQPRPDLATFGSAVDLPEARGLVLKPGTDRELVESNCTTCHSLAPIVRHEGFTPEVWEAEVGKMIKRYGARIDDDTAQRITGYLQRNYASQPRPAAGTSEAPGVR